MVLFVVSIIACSIFFTAALIFFIVWIISMFRNGLQKSCPACAAMVPFSASFCPHCGAEMPVSDKKRGGHKSLLVLFFVCLALMGISIAGIVYGAISAGIGVSEATLLSVNLNQNGTSSSWNLNFEKVKGGWLRKNIVIDTKKSKKLSVMTHFKSGSADVQISQNGLSLDQICRSGETSSITLNSFKSGPATLTVTIKDATGGAINIWW